jgi:DNA-directed RNA polymerase subunit RPC12/RpoP
MTINVLYQCNNCNGWSEFKHYCLDTIINHQEARCEHCNGRDLNPRSCISERTFQLVKVKGKLPTKVTELKKNNELAR